MTDEITDSVHSVSVSELRSFIDRIENLEEQKSEINDSIRDVQNEAKSLGYDVKAIRTIIRMRRREGAREKRDHEESVLDHYIDVLGVV